MTKESLLSISPIDGRYKNKIKELENYLSEISDKNLYSYNVYQIEGEGKKLFSEIKGDVDTIMGLPIKNIRKYLENIK